jgi:hypothetical protein
MDMMPPNLPGSIHTDQPMLPLMIYTVMEPTSPEPSPETTESVLPQKPNGFHVKDLTIKEVEPMPTLSLASNIWPAHIITLEPEVDQTVPKPHISSQTHGDQVVETPLSMPHSTHGTPPISGQFLLPETQDQDAHPLDHQLIQFQEPSQSVPPKNQKPLLHSPQEDQSDKPNLTHISQPQDKMSDQPVSHQTPLTPPCPELQWPAHTPQEFLL